MSTHSLAQPNTIHFFDYFNHAVVHILWRQLKLMIHFLGKKCMQMCRDGNFCHRQTVKHQVLAFIHLAAGACLLTFLLFTASHIIITTDGGTILLMDQFYYFWVSATSAPVP